MTKDRTTEHFVCLRFTAHPSSADRLADAIVALCAAEFDTTHVTPVARDGAVKWLLVPSSPAVSPAGGTPNEKDG